MAPENARRDRQGAAPGRRQKKVPLYAAVDLGTNNCRLLIARPASGGFRILDSHSQLARLGEGLAHSGRISDAAVQRAMLALDKIRGKMRAKRVAHVRCIATEACRRAENGAEFVTKVREELGLTFKIISPDEEARLAMIGCHDLLKASAGHVLVVDIGGGSTELSLVRSGQAKSAVGFRALLSSKLIDVWGSLPLGVVTLYDSFASQPEDKAFAAMRVHARQVVGDWAHSQRVREAMASGGHIIGTSGTVTCLAGVHLNLAKYRRSDVDGVWMDRQEAGDAIKRLVDLGHAGRAKLPTIGQDRAKLMLSGCAILEAIWEVFGAERMQVADRGLREGLLLTMMYGPRRKSRRRRAGKQERAEGGGKARDGRG